MDDKNIVHWLREIAKEINDSNRIARDALEQTKRLANDSEQLRKDLVA
jgi:hypothetical protein